MEIPSSTVNCTKSTQFANPHRKSHKISGFSQICATLIILLFLVLDTHKAGSNPLFARITRNLQPSIGIRVMFTFVYISKYCINNLY